ncbi:MAG: hypothetical protein PHY57_06940 [Ignavibacterium sp.]|jgi:hypothetical protein|nr:hypothetical protein [Ignavibacterium sp.]MDX9713383.1 hypothetical protein [Ignavibacteriaceae bacterium]GIK21510.1 MAG: hypothetical protein BroJett005_09240 [Ignavibacteriota bacterium]
MENKGYIEIRVSGFKGNLKLTPDTYDIRELSELIEQVERMLFPGERKERPLISYHIEEGSVKNIFKTTAQTVIGFSAILGQVQSLQNIDFLELNTAKAFETLQETAIKKDYSFEIGTSVSQSQLLIIDKSTFFYRTTENWVDAEFYFFGRITNAGGKDKANIHLLTDELGTLYIQTPQEFLAKAEENILYKTYVIRAKGKQNSETGEIDKQSLTFLNLIDYSSKYDEKYLETLRSKAIIWLNKINPDDWLKDIRGYDA